MKVHGSFETGSFKINFQSSVSAWDRAKDLLNSEEMAAIVTAGDLVQFLLFGGFGVAGLIGLTKFLRGTFPTKVYEDDDGRLKIYRGDKYIKAEKAVLDLYKDYKTRKALEKVIQSPLEEGKVEEIALNQPGSPDFTVVHLSEREYFTAPDLEREDVNEYKYTAYLSINRLSFKEGNKWNVFDGANSINVTVEDENFLSSVDDGSRRFGKGDRLKAKIRVEQFEVDNGLRTEYFIEEVLDHEPPEFKGQPDLLEP